MGMRLLLAVAAVVAAVAVGCSPDDPGEEPGYLDEPNAAVAAATDG
jgi:hypothetical protein